MDFVPVLNHEEVEGGVVRGHDIHGDEALDMQVGILRKFIKCRTSSDTCAKRYSYRGGY